VAVEAAAAACIGEATRKPSAKQARRRARSHVPMASASCVAPGGGRRVHGLGQARERTSRARGLVRVRVQHAHRPRARSGRADRSCAACVAAGRAGGHTCGWWVSLGCEEVDDDVDRGVDCLARVLVCRGASIVMCALGGCGVRACVRSGVWRGYHVDLAWRLGEEGGTGRRSHLEMKRRLNLELKGALAGGGRGGVVLMKLVGRTRGLADRGGRREGLVLRGLRAGTRNV